MLPSIFWFGHLEMLPSVRGKETKWADTSVEFESRAGLRPAVTRAGGVPHCWGRKLLHFLGQRKIVQQLRGVRTGLWTPGLSSQQRRAGESLGIKPV